MYIKSITVTYTSSGGDDPQPTTPTATVTFTPGAGEVASGTTVALALSGGTADGIKYTINGADVTISSATYNSNSPIEITAATTIKAAAFNQSGSQIALGNPTSASYTIASTPISGDEYELVKSLNSSDVGKEFILVYINSSDATKNAVFGGLSSTSTVYGISETGTSNLSKNGNTITIPNGSKAVPLTLRAGNTTGNWAFEFDGNKYFTWTGGNSLNSASSITAQSSWAVSIDSDGNATITNESTNTRILKYNTSSPRFACYDNGQSLVQLYRKVDNATAHAITTVVTPTGAGTITIGSEISDPTQVEKEAEVGFDVVANAHYRLKSVTASSNVDDLIEIDGSYMFTMPNSDVTITATFDPLYAIDLSNENTKGTAITLGEAAEGDDVEVMIEEGAAYAFSNFVVTKTSNGDVVTTVTTLTNGSATFTMPGYPVTVTVNYVDFVPTITPANGTRFTSTQEVKLSCPGAALLMYTTDDTTPSYTNSVGTDVNNPYTLTLNATTTVKVIGVKDDNTESTVASATFTLVPQKPGISIANSTAIQGSENTYEGQANVTISQAVNTNTVYYTLDGSNPADDTNPERLSFTGQASKLVVVNTVGQVNIRAVVKDAAGEYSDENSRTITIIADHQNLYIFGNTLNGLSDWDLTQGVLMDYNATTQTYSARVYFAAADNYFQFAQAMASTTESGWDGLTGRIYPDTNNANVSVDNYDMDGSVPLSLTTNSNDFSFKIPAGIYTISVKLGSDYKCYVNQQALSVTLSPNGGDINVGETVTATEDISTYLQEIDANLNATVTYTVDGGTAQTGSSVTLDTKGSHTVAFTAAYGNITKTGSATFNVKKADSNVYQLTTTLTAGEKYIIVSEDMDDVMGAYDSANSRYTSATSSGYSLDKTNHIVTLNNGSDVTVLTLGETAGQWTLADGSNYLSWTSGNTLAQNSSISGNSEKWSITFDGNNASILNVSDSENQRVIMRNSNSNIFACYKTAQTAVQLYKQIEVGDYTVTLTKPASGGTISADKLTANEGDVVTLTATPADGYQFSAWSVKDANDNAVTVTGNTFTMPASDVTVTVTFTAIDYTITVTQATGGNITSPVNGATANVDDVITLTATVTDGYQLTAWSVYKTGDTQTTITVDANNQFTMPAYNVTVTASYKQQANVYFEKVTSTTDLEDGEYLIVYETGSVAFNGARANTDDEKLDAANNTIAVTIDGNEIEATPEALAAVFTIITTNNGSSTIKSASGFYIGRTTNSNGLDANETTTYAHTITIDGDGNADIACNLENNKTISLRFNAASNQNRFRYYTNKSQQAIQLYKLVDLPLAKLLTKGQKGETYTITNQLVGVYADDNNNTLWAKDEATSIDANEKPEDYTDFLLEEAFTGDALSELQSKITVPTSYSQNNWIALVMPAGTTASNYEGKYLPASTVTGQLTDDVNYELTLTKAPGAPETPESAFVKNVYTPANFVSTFWGENTDQIYFVKPKVQEVVNIAWAVWNGTSFVMPENCPAGSFTPDFSMNSEANPTLKVGDAYAFEAVIEVPASALSGARRLKNAGSPTSFTVKPLSLTSSSPVTGINTVGGGVKEVKSVRVYNVAGVEQRELQTGVNIVVTTYTDGTRSTAKVLK